VFRYFCLQVQQLVIWIEVLCFGR